MRAKRWISRAMICVLIMAGLQISGCGKNAAGEVNRSEDVSQEGKKQNFSGSVSGETIRILSGSENKELEQILEDCAKETGVTIQMTYKGSVDIMHELEQGAGDYDAVWPASSLWLSIGDTGHLVKHAESVSNTPVVFAIRQSKAQELDFVGKELSVKDILDAIKQGKLTFCMTSATQSNSGASAYIGFLYALLGKQDSITVEDLEKPLLQEEIKDLLSGIDRSSGSSDWLKEMFLKGNYDAMVNYECLVISTNQELEREGREPLYVVYPYDGLSLADSPLGYVDHDNENKEKAFLAVQEYLMSEDTQNAIQRTGRRTGFTGVEEENQEIFRTDWGIDTGKILSPIPMPSAEVLQKALLLYQTQFKKPSLNVYCLDFSGSMAGNGNSQLVEAMSQILLQENAEKNLLQAGQGEVNIAVIFSDGILDVYEAADSDDISLETLYQQIEGTSCGGGTDIYLAVEKALELIEDNYDLSEYTPAIILLTDGMSNGTETLNGVKKAFQAAGSDVPVFSIMFGDAREEELDDLAALTNARVFDGREDLIGAFRSVKGYN